MRKYDLTKTDFSAEKPFVNHFLDEGKIHAVQICLKKGFEIPPHPEDYAVFLMVLEGEGVFTDGGGEVCLGKGQGAYFKKGGMRGIKAKSDLVILGMQDREK